MLGHRMSIIISLDSQAIAWIDGHAGILSYPFVSHKFCIKYSKMIVN